MPLAATPAQAQDPEWLREVARFDAARTGSDVPSALALGRHALALADAGNDPVARAQRADLLLGIADLEAARGDPLAALAAAERALALRTQELGPDHPDLAALLTRIASLQQQAGRVPDAAATLQRAVAILRSSYGPRHLRVRQSLSALQALYAKRRPLGRCGLHRREIDALDRSSREVPAATLPQPGKDRRYTQKDGFASVRVFYGTNRAPTGERNPANFYGAQRGELQFGYCDVTIPETHKEGELETASRWSMLTINYDPQAARRRFVLLQTVQPLPRDRFLTALRAHMASSPTRELLVFIHGYNNTFEDASRRAAQLVYDLDFDGTPVMFSWPSKASTTSYTADEATVGISGRRLADFLQVVAAEAGATRVHIVAHSMGNRALLDALPLYVAARTSQQPGSRLGQIVFTAPDVDRDLFVDTIGRLAGVSDRLTLYASDSDMALKTSEALHGAPRAGLAGERLVVLRGLDSIDMSSIDADLLGHTYFAADTGAIYDLFRLLWRGDPPPKRCGMVGRKGAGAANAWVFNVTDCHGQELCCWPGCCSSASATWLLAWCAHVLPP
ncbi:MAG: alpha/beta hydrolase [Steroidobacteraceae bacterium]